MQGPRTPKGNSNGSSPLSGPKVMSLIGTRWWVPFPSVGSLLQGEELQQKFLIVASVLKGGLQKLPATFLLLLGLLGRVLNVDGGVQTRACVWERSPSLFKLDLFSTAQTRP